jgi:hypothetical protein
MIRRSGNRITGAVHNLNETYDTFKLDEKSSTPGQLLQSSLLWQTRNFKHQSIDGCLLTSFAMLLKENAQADIEWTAAQEDTLAQLLTQRYTTSNKAQLAIKEACPQWNNPQFAKLDSNYLVSNGLKHLAQGLKLPCVRDKVRSWKAGF